MFLAAIIIYAMSLYIAGTINMKAFFCALSASLGALLLASVV